MARSRIRRLVAAPSPDQLFTDAFEVFQLDFFRKSSDRATELTQALDRLAASPEIQNAVNPLALHLKVYRQFLDGMGNDFINDVQEIIVPHCDEILCTS